MKTEFIPCYDREESPSRLDLEKNIETPIRIELGKELVGTIIQFHGVHADSKYICKIDSQKRIKIWFKGMYPSAIAPIETIISLSRLNTGLAAEKGVLEIGKAYVLPHFYYQHGASQETRLIIDPMLRMEHYTSLFLKRP